MKLARLPAAALLMLCAGCGAWHGAADRAAAVAVDFQRAVADGDGAAACELLADTAVEALENSQNDCATAVLEQDVAGPGDVAEVQVWGRAAQVTTTDDTFFLTMTDGRWAIRAAGCEPDPPRPYQCSIDGS